MAGGVLSDSDFRFLTRDTRGIDDDVDEVGFGCIVTDSLFGQAGKTIYITVGERVSTVQFERAR